MKLLINGKVRKIMYNKKDNMYYYKCKGGTVDASKYFLKGDKVFGLLNEGSLKKQYKKMLVGGGSGSNVAPLSPVKEETDYEINDETDDEINDETDDEINEEFIKSFNNNNNNIHNALGFLIQYKKTRHSVIKQNEALTNLLNKLITIDIYNSYDKAAKTRYNADLKSYIDIIYQQINSKKTEGGNPPKKDLKTFLSKLRILIKEFE